VAQFGRVALATRSAALSGSHNKAPGFAGGYLLDYDLTDPVLRTASLVNAGTKYVGEDYIRGSFYSPTTRPPAESGYSSQRATSVAR
jgi:hypothetical protein